MAEEPNSVDLQKRIASGSASPNDYLALAEIQRRAGRFQEAIDTLRTVTKLPSPRLMKARATLELGWTIYESAIQDDSPPVLARHGLQLLEDEPELPEVLLYRGLGHSLLAHHAWNTDPTAGADQARTALRWLDRVIAEGHKQSHQMEAYQEGARLWNLLSDGENAVAWFQQALRMDLSRGDRCSCLVGYAEALLTMHCVAEAKDAIDQALPLGRDVGMLPRVYFSLGVVQSAMGHLMEARGAFGSALVELDKHPYLSADHRFRTELYIQLGAIHHDTGELRDAVAYFDRVVALHPEDDSEHRTALLWLGRCYQSLGQNRRARRCYEALLASDRASETEKSMAREGIDTSR